MGFYGNRNTTEIFSENIPITEGAIKEKLKQLFAKGKIKGTKVGGRLQSFPVILKLLINFNLSLVI